MNEQRAPASQHLPALVAVLDELAYGSDDEPQHQWEMFLSPVVWRVTAATAETYSDAATAQAGANSLVEALLAASQAQVRDVRQGADRGFYSDGYRGVVEVVLKA